MKVAMLSANNSKVIKYGGKQIHQNLLEKGLLELGIDVSTFYPLFEAERLKRIIRYTFSDPITVFSLYHRLKHYFFKDIINFFSILNLEEYDIVHAHDVLSIYPIVHPNTVLTLHSYFSRERIIDIGNKTSEKNKQKIFKLCMDIEKQAITKAKHIITVDNRIKNYVVEQFDYPMENVTVIYNAVNTDIFNLISDEMKVALRKELNLPKDAFIVLVPRRYVKKNGVDYAARAFSKIKSNDYFFVFAGGGQLKQEIEEILKDNNNTLVLDAVSNDLVHKYYKASDVILIPSVTSNNLEEATSLSMLEGMACGKVVVCTNIGGMKEVVKHMENGILIEQKNIDAIIETLQYIKNNYDELSELRQRAREYVVKNHSYIEHAKKVVEVYSKVLNKF